VTLGDEDLSCGAKNCDLRFGVGVGADGEPAFEPQPAAARAKIAAHHGASSGGLRMAIEVRS
jgi:hypothetical protein